MVMSPGLAYDIDVSRPPEILGTIAGADTLIAIVDENVTREHACEVLQQFLPDQHHALQKEAEKSQGAND